jgi:hypothetical protein
MLERIYIYDLFIFFINFTNSSAPYIHVCSVFPFVIPSSFEDYASVKSWLPVRASYPNSISRLDRSFPSAQRQISNKMFQFYSDIFSVVQLRKEKARAAFIKFLIFCSRFITAVHRLMPNSAKPASWPSYTAECIQSPGALRESAVRAQHDPGEN